jgi:class 3 adenylate cyclase
MATVQRRLGVILCSDIVGHGAPSGADEAGATPALKAHREATDPLFLQEGGRFVKTAESGVVLEFPSAFNAVRASLGVQRLMAERNAELPPDQRVVFRMGIHLGDVVVEDEDISGDGINVAERLQEIADPGGICLSRAAHAAIHKDFDSLFPDGGTKALKDIDAPVHIYNLAPEAAMLPFVPAMTVPRRLLPLIVLPFANLSGEARHDFLADSITDQLTSELARIEDSFVVDRKTALTSAADTTEAAELGQRLGIRYIVRGSVSAGEAGLRLDAALIDAETGQDVWADRLDIAIGDPFVMQHDANARLVPRLYARLLSASGHTPQAAPTPVFRPTPPVARAAESEDVRWTAPPPPQAAQPQAASAAEAQEVPWAAPPSQPQAELRETSQPETEAPQSPSVPAEAISPPRVSALSALAARWPVLRRPSPRLPVPPLPTPAARVAAPVAEVAAAEPPPVPAMIIRPRTVIAPGPATGRLLVFPAAAASSGAVPPPPAPGPHTAQIFEMPTPSLSDRARPRWQMPFLWRLFFTLCFAALAGAIAAALLGIQRETIVEIGSWMLIAAGLSQLAIVIAEWGQSGSAVRLVERPAPAPIRAPRPRPTAAEILRVRAVPRLPRDISDSRQRAP